MTDIVALDVSLGAKFLMIAFEHGFAIFEGPTSMTRKYYKDIGVKRISCGAVSPDGTKACLGVTCPGETRDEESTKHEVLIWNAFYDSMEADFSFDVPVQSVLIRNRFVVVVLTNSVCMYDITTKNIIFEQMTSENLSGGCDLSFNEEFPLLAMCGLAPGSIQVSRIGKGGRPVIVQAHLHPISRICLNKQETLVATTSDRGTIIRVFDCLSGNLSSIFRRGSLPSDTTCLAFSPDNFWIVALSAKGTVHLFDNQMKCTDEAKAPRSIAKLRLEPAPMARMAFTAPKTFIIVTSQGICYNISLASKILTKLSTTLVIAH